MNRSFRKSHKIDFFAIRLLTLSILLDFYTAIESGDLVSNHQFFADTGSPITWTGNGEFWPAAQELYLNEDCFPIRGEF